MEFWFSEFHTPDVKHSIRVSRQLYSKQSDYQRIDIFETPSHPCRFPYHSIRIQRIHVRSFRRPGVPGIGPHHTQ